MQDRQSFGAAMKAARKASDTSTLRALRAALEERGDSITEAALSGYERGEYAPDRDRTMLIEDVLGVAPLLTELLGYSRDDDPRSAISKLQEAVDFLMETTQTMRQRIKQLEDQRGQGASGPGAPPR